MRDLGISSPRTNYSVKIGLSHAEIRRNQRQRSDDINRERFGTAIRVLLFGKFQSGQIGFLVEGPKFSKVT
jgi:hypothetical protein